MVIRKALCLIALCCLGSVALFSQSCGTTLDELTEAIAWRKTHRPTTTARNDVFHIPVKLHSFGSDNGHFRLDSFLVQIALEDANDIYASADIVFVQCGAVNEINSSEHLEFEKYTDEYICDEHDAEGAINIYFAPNVVRQDGSTLCGYAYGYANKNRVIMDNGCALNGTTLAHELGHSLSMLHTHSRGLGVELVDGSNCNIAGDLLCDTPADPNLSDHVNSSCVYTGGEMDPNGQPYQPDTRNVMSYSRKSCRTHFSQQQIDQMREYHEDHMALLSCGADSISAIASIDDISSDVSVYPNPVINEWRIDHIPTDAVLTMTDINGRELWKRCATQTTMLFDKSDIKIGMNILTISSKHSIQIIPIITL